MSKVSATQIKQWKEVHGLINKGILKEISTDKDGNPVVIEHEFYFRDIKIQDLEIAATKDTEVAKIESFFDQCYLGGSDEVLKNDQMKYSAAKYINATWKVYEVEIVKI